MLSIGIAAFLGVVTWSFLEYTLHRFLGHDRRTMPNFFSVEHTRHHSEGNYFAPAVKKAGAALGATLITLPLALLVVEPVIGGVFTAAFVAMYVTYEIVHRRAHTHAGIGSYGRYLRRHHFHHHFGNPKANHGVTSPVWDFVFGTFESPLVIRVPEKLAMRWLVDEQTGGVRSMFSDVYTLVPRRRSA